MKILGISDSGGRQYICEVSHSEIEKFLNLYYGKLKALNVGQEVDLGKGYDYSTDIAAALQKTQEFIRSNQAVVTAILNGLSITRAQPEETP